MDTLALKRTIVLFQVKETALILAASVVLPYLVHLVPSVEGIPLGARLLPVFYAPFIAVVLFRPHVAVITGLCSPILNSMLTGQPLPEMVFVLTLELMLFCALSYLIQRRWKQFCFTAPLAYLISLLVVTRALGMARFFLPTIITALPGIAALAVLNIFLLRFQSQ